MRLSFQYAGESCLEGNVSPLNEEVHYSYQNETVTTKMNKNEAQSIITTTLSLHLG